MQLIRAMPYISNDIALRAVQVPLLVGSICVPFGVMIVATLKRRGETASPQYGKWALLFALTFIFNAFIVLKSNFITTVDLVVKLVACLLPPSAVTPYPPRTTLSNALSRGCTWRAC